MSLPKESIELLLATGRAQLAVQKGDGGEAFFIKPDGNPVSLKQFFSPTRIRQTVSLASANSFCEYFNRFAGSESMIFAEVDSDSANFVAILDYHAPAVVESCSNGPNYCEHVAQYETEPTPEWKAWLGANRKAMNQVDFATWLEDNLHLFVTPPADKNAPSGADLLELVKSLHGHQTAQFNTALRLDNGAYTVKYEEAIDVRGTIKSDSLTLPPFIYGGFSLFEGMGGYLVKARLKTRIENRKLVLFFETVALENTVRDCLKLVAKEIEEKAERKILLGTPTAKNSP
jgi:uncharacterized protein YfdQ (DUF2303 family)